MREQIGCTAFGASLMTLTIGAFASIVNPPAGLVLLVVGCMSGAAACAILGD